MSEPLEDGSELVRYTDAVTRELVEVVASPDELAAWRREGGPPDSLEQHRQSLDEAIAITRAQCEGKRSEIRQLWE